MNEVKNIPILRFPEFNEVWNQFKLKDVSKYSNGGSFENDVNEHGRYELVTLKSINTEGNLVSSGRYIDKDVKTLQEGTLVMILSEQAPGLLGMTAIIPCDNKYVLNQRVAEIRPTNEINSFFLSSVINVNQRYFSKHGAGMKVQNISKPNVEKFEFYIPSLYEQQKIGDFLTLVDKRIELLENKKNLLETYKKGVMKKIFNQEIRFKDDNGSDFPYWEEKKLGDITNKKSSNISANSIESNEGNYTIYGATGELKEVDFFEMNTPYISIVKDGSGVGRVKLCKPYSSVLGTLDIITNNETSDLNFIYQFLTKTSFLKFVTGSSIPHIYYKDYSKLKLSVPSIKEQEKISKFMSSIDSQIELLVTQIDKSKTWKKGLLQKMFV